MESSSCLREGSVEARQLYQFDERLKNDPSNLKPLVVQLYPRSRSRMLPLARRIVMQSTKKSATVFALSESGVNQGQSSPSHKELCLIVHRLVSKKKRERAGQFYQFDASSKNESHDCSFVVWFKTKQHHASLNAKRDAAMTLSYFLLADWASR